MKRLALLLSSLVVLTTVGCHTGTYNAVSTTEAVLTSNNYKVVMSNVKGEDAGFKVFGLGSSAQYSKAMEKIRVQAQLDDRSRGLINVTTDENWWSVGIVGGDSLTITADVIEYTGPPAGTQ